jgi:hypothetical protein
MRNAVTSLLVAASLLMAASAGAQPVERNNIEIGGGLGGLMSWWIHPRPGADVRVTFPIDRRFAIDTLVAMTPTQDNETYGLYGVLVKQRIGARAASDLQPFLSYGVIGVFARTHEDEYRYLTGTGATVVRPAYDDTTMTPPLIGMIGGGIERRVLPRLSVRVEAQALILLVLPVGVRVAAGVSVPIGRLAQAPAGVVSR